MNSQVIYGNYDKILRLIRHGCPNRPFYQIVVQESNAKLTDPPIEQLGSYDPIPNVRNEKLVAINFSRLRYWIGEGVAATQPVLKLMGYSGVYPIHPMTYMNAKWRRKAREEGRPDLPCDMGEAFYPAKKKSYRKYYNSTNLVPIQFVNPPTEAPLENPSESLSK